MPTLLLWVLLPVLLPPPPLRKSPRLDEELVNAKSLSLLWNWDWDRKWSGCGGSSVVDEEKLPDASVGVVVEGRGGGVSTSGYGGGGGGGGRGDSKESESDGIARG